MAIFKDKWIILYRKKQSKWNDIYFVFSASYWKIVCSKKPSKNEKNYDIWTEISMEIEVKEGINIHNIRNLKIKKEFNYEGKTYSTLENLLKILAYTKQNSPDGIENPLLYKTLEQIYIPTINETKLILIKLKIYHALWVLNIFHENETISKILKFISVSTPEKIMKLKDIPEDIKKELDLIV